MSLALAIGTLLAVGSLAYVLYPLIRPRTSSDDEIEAAIRAYRAAHVSARGSAMCQTCGPRPEPDAVYCSICGRRLGEAQPVR